MGLTGPCDPASNLATRMLPVLFKIRFWLSGVLSDLGSAYLRDHVFSIWPCQHLKISREVLFYVLLISVLVGWDLGGSLLQTQLLEIFPYGDATSSVPLNLLCELKMWLFQWILICWPSISFCWLLLCFFKIITLGFESCFTIKHYSSCTSTRYLFWLKHRRSK